MKRRRRKKSDSTGPMRERYVRRRHGPHVHKKESRAPNPGIQDGAERFTKCVD